MSVSTPSKYPELVNLVPGHFEPRKEHIGVVHGAHAKLVIINDHPTKPGSCIVEVACWEGAGYQIHWLEKIEGGIKRDAIAWYLADTEEMRGATGIEWTMEEPPVYG